MQPLTSVNTRKQLLELYQHMLVEIRGDLLVARELHHKPLKVNKIALMASGKAAASMTAGATQVLGDRIVDARVITKAGYCHGLEQDTSIHCLEAGHPLPDVRSLAVGAELVEWLSRLPAEVSLLVLTSGGSSTLVEMLPQASSLEDLLRLNQWLLGSGLDIRAMNRIRQSVSCIKGGGLLACVPPTVSIEHLILSDVPGDDPAIVGSGLFVATTAYIGSDTENRREELELPGWVQAMQQAAVACRAFQGEKRQSSRQITHRIVGSNTMACRRATEIAAKMGMGVHLHAQPLEGEAVVQGWVIARYLREQAEAGLHIWGGETTVVLPAQPGRGGRNQHLALAAALELAGTDGINLLAAGTDGSDGPTEDAGAIVDGDTVRRGETEGLDARFALQQADAGHFLEASGDLVSTGVTGTNVMDIVLAFKQG